MLDGKADGRLLAAVSGIGETNCSQGNPGRDTFEFDQGHVSKNQPITVLILLSESQLYNNG